MKQCEVLRIKDFQNVASLLKKQRYFAAVVICCDKNEEF